MFTSRAEFRLQLREDNADLRLTEVGRRLGLVEDSQWDVFCRKRDAVSRETERLRGVWVTPTNLPSQEALEFLGKPLEHEVRLLDLLRRPGVDFSVAERLSNLIAPSSNVSRETLSRDLGAELATSVIEQVEITAKYAGYIDRQIEEVERAAGYEHLPLPADFDYGQIKALSFEVRQRLNQHHPQTLGQASRIPGITPSAIALLLVHLKKGNLRSTDLRKRGTAA